MLDMATSQKDFPTFKVVYQLLLKGLFLFQNGVMLPYHLSYFRYHCLSMTPTLLFLPFVTVSKNLIPIYQPLSHMIKNISQMTTPLLRNSLIAYLLFRLLYHWVKESPFYRFFCRTKPFHVFNSNHKAANYLFREPFNIAKQFFFLRGDDLAYFFFKKEFSNEGLKVCL